MARILHSTYVKPRRAKRPGVHSKSKSSNLTSSKNYNKKYRGQGR